MLCAKRNCLQIAWRALSSAPSPVNSNVFTPDAMVPLLLPTTIIICRAAAAWCILCTLLHIPSQPRSLSVTALLLPRTSQDSTHHPHPLCITPLRLPSMTTSEPHLHPHQPAPQPPPCFSHRVRGAFPWAVNTPGGCSGSFQPPHSDQRWRHVHAISSLVRLLSGLRHHPMPAWLSYALRVISLLGYMDGISRQPLPTEEQCVIHSVAEHGHRLFCLPV